MTLMDHKTFFTTFTGILDKRVAGNPNIPQQVRDDLEKLKKDIRLMPSLGVKLLDEIQAADPQATELCKYEIDGHTFCRAFPPEMCTKLMGTSVPDCGNIPDDWNVINWTA